MLMALKLNSLFNENAALIERLKSLSSLPSNNCSCIKETFQVYEKQKTAESSFYDKPLYCFLFLCTQKFHRSVKENVNWHLEVHEAQRKRREIEKSKIQKASWISFIFQTHKKRKIDFSSDVFLQFQIIRGNYTCSTFILVFKITLSHYNLPRILLHKSKKLFLSKK